MMAQNLLHQLTLYPFNVKDTKCRIKILAKYSLLAIINDLGQALLLSICYIRAALYTQTHGQVDTQINTPKYITNIMSKLH